MKLASRISQIAVLIVLVVGVSFAQTDRKPRVFVLPSDSWSLPRTLPGGGLIGDFLLGARGGASPQTAEIIKTFGERCKESVVNLSRDNAEDVWEFVLT